MDGNGSSNKSSTSTTSSRSVHFLPALTSRLGNESDGGPLQSIPSVQDDGEDGDDDAISDRFDRQAIAFFASPQQEGDGWRSSNSSSVKRNTRATRHMSLSLRSQNQQAPSYLNQTTPQAENRDISGHIESDVIDNATNSDMANDSISPHKPTRLRAKSEPPPPSLLRRFSSLPINGDGRARRPTLSEAGVKIVAGVTDASPHPGVMAATMMSIMVDVLGPREVLKRHVSTLEQASPVENPKQNGGQHVSEPLRRHLRVLIWTYLKMALKFCLTVKGFFVATYLCLVIAFGGMLFLILVGAAPAMNRHDGPDGTDTPGKRWIEIDSQVLNALFCVTGFGLMPQRTKHLYFLIRGQLDNQERADVQLMRRYPWYVPGRNWWALAAVLYLYELNSCFQVVMAAGMWAYNRHNRPPWLTGMSMGLGFA
ncbi:uncharacterized protein V1513DRAFT_376066 [Lipomyces chichibuensis]|uniref:uncharacterized protein n=1 Tax=Lipomyces chichibuensis TaxID=1546026 RepID=UPI003343399D